jgi:hypothetical protein
VSVELVSLAVAARLTGADLGTLRSRAQRGLLPVVRQNGRRLVPLAALEAAGHPVPAPGPSPLARSRGARVRHARRREAEAALVVRVAVARHRACLAELRAALAE